MDEATVHIEAVVCHVVCGKIQAALKNAQPVPPAMPALLYSVVQGKVDRAVSSPSYLMQLVVQMPSTNQSSPPQAPDVEPTTGGILPVVASTAELKPLG